MFAEKIVPTPREEYRFLIRPDDYFGTPVVTLQYKSKGLFWDHWTKVKTYSTTNLLDDASPDVVGYTEATMRHMWEENLEREKFNMQLSDYWKSEDAHADFSVAGEIEAGTEDA